MDPLSTMSLACNIIQVVDFSTKVVNGCRQLYKDGALSGNNDVEAMTKYHTSLRNHLDVPSQRSPDELLKLGRKVSDTAEDLIKELQKLKIKQPRKKREVASKVFKTLWKKETIDEIWGRLCDYRKILDTHILVDLRKHFDLLFLQQNKGFEILDKQVQIMIKSLAAGVKGYDELVTAIHSESKSIKVHVDDGFQQHEKSLAYNEYFQRFLQSLWFPDIKRRQETIKEAHEMTFKWIFETEEKRKNARRWDDFIQWLEKGREIYWIHGKAGSGKSTLMNYLYHEDRSHNSLKAWSGIKELVTISFSFWNAGSSMEKSSKGLLRSLLHQVLERYPNLMPPPDQAASDPHSAGNGLHTYGPIAAWTERRLQTILHRVMHQLQESCCICIFIDGLDEFVGDGDALIATLKKLQSPELKLCLSSRPDQPYSDAFGSFPKLRLQDLTEADIKVFVSDKLQAPMQAIHAKGVTEFFNTIVRKAQGVFLWVELVVKDVLIGLQNGDDLHQLNERLRLMPSDIEKLYAHMLSNIHGIYQTQAAELFHMAFANRTGSLLNLSLALYKAFDQVSHISIQDAIKFCDLAKKRIPIICAGLLEIHIDEEQPEWSWNLFDSYLTVPIQYGPSPELAEMFRYERSYHVDFIHRTSVDFLRKSEQGKRFMDEHSPSSWNPYNSHVRALLAKVSLLGFPEIPADRVGDFGMFGYPVERIPRNFVYEVMNNVAMAEQYTCIAQVLLCEDIDRTLTFVHQRRSGHSMNDHWCVQLGICWIRLTGNEARQMSIESRPSSQPSSAKSYHSAISEQVDHNRLKPPSTKPEDMLGLACSHGLYHYVCHVLNSRRDFYDQKTATYLLCCSMWALCYQFLSSYGDEYAALGQYRGSAHVIYELLKRGADPNFYVEDFSRTIWGQFLSSLEFCGFSEQTALGPLPKVFFDHGANMNEILCTEGRYPIFGIANLNGRVEKDPSKMQDYSTRRERSAMYILQDFLRGTPDFEALENACLSKGASSFSRVTHLGLLDENRYCQPHEVTDLQCSRFEAAVKRCNRHLNIETGLQLRYARQLAKIWKEITNHPGEIDSVDISDEETTSDSAEDFHSSKSQISLSS